MSPLERLFRLEVEFRRMLRMAGPGAGDAAPLHTSYALQSGYERLLACVGPVSRRDIEVLRERSTLAGDERDILAARDSLSRMLGMPEL